MYSWGQSCGAFAHSGCAGGNPSSSSCATIRGGGGAFCRLLKLRLKTHSSLNREVFLDSDNLQDLAVLFGIVANDTDTLVVLCSKEILCRPWCVGEMTTARIVGVDTMLVTFPDFQHPPQDLMVNYELRRRSFILGTFRHQHVDGDGDALVARHTSINNAPP